MELDSFAAKRREQLDAGDEKLGPAVASALANFGEDGWSDPILDVAETIWLENYVAETGAASRAGAARFRQRLSEALDKSETAPNADRVMRWVSTYAVNAGTIQGAYRNGVRYKIWVDMEDDDVRSSHRHAAGQVVPIGGAFTVAGVKYGYPGEPVGPVENWINCRCVAMPASRTGEKMSDTTYDLGSNPHSRALVAAGAVVEAETEAGTVYYGPFDTVENAQAWIESDNGPGDGSYGVIALTDVPDPEAVIAAAVEPTAEIDADPVDTVDDEIEDDEELIEEIPVHGVLAPEGVETGDGRGFREGALSSRPLPYPLRLETVGSHGGNNTSEVVTVGRIDEAWRDEATKQWRFRGAVILSKPGAAAAIEGIIDGSGRGVSIDADAMAVDMDGFSDEVIAAAEAAGKNPTTWFSETRIAGLTIVPIPAFHEAYIALGHEFEEDMTEEALAAAAAVLEDCGCAEADVDRLATGGIVDPDKMRLVGDQGSPDYVIPLSKARQIGYVADDGSFAPGTKDGPGWITHPVPTSRIRRYWVRGEGAAKIKWGAPGDFDRCRRQLAKYVQNPEWLAGLCANMHKEALGVWPGQEGGGGNRGHHSLVASGAMPSPILNLVSADDEEGAIAASATFPGGYPAEWFANPRFREVTPLTIDKTEGRIWGHLAQWGVCHVGVAGQCVQPPHSTSGYANFLKGVVDTTAGEQRVGCLTYGIGHADIRLRAAAATAHYDQIDAVVAYVNVGEDAYGIWYSGVLAPGVDEALVDKFRAVGAISGDWRPIGRYGHDLIAGVAVNTPGFPTAIAASAGEITAIVAAGMVLQPERDPEPETFADANQDYLASAIALALEKRENKKREEATRKRALSLRRADVLRRLNKEG